MRVLLATAVLALAGPAHAADPLKSPACGEALAALQAARGAGAADVDARRGAATRACLGGTGAASRPAPVAREPIAVPPPTIALPTPQPLPGPPAAPSPPLAVDRPPVITACDAGGCWDSNGTRMHSAGPLLIGPAGVCTTAGNTVRCP